MATLTINPVDDGYINNISGIYNSEDTNSSASSSSSNANQNTAYMFFDTRDATTGLTGATITALTLRYYGETFGDIAQVAAWIIYTDQNEVWGRFLDSGDPMNPASGTYQESPGAGTAIGQYNEFSIPVAHMGNRASKFTNFAIYASLSDLGPAHFYFGAMEGNAAHRPQLVITYTLPSTGAPQRSLTGAGT